MSAEILRRAASGIRAEFAEANDWMTESERSFYLAVADVLDVEADCELPPDYDESTDVGRHFLLKVARAYLGESS